MSLGLLLFGCGPKSAAPLNSVPIPSNWPVYHTQLNQETCCTVIAHAGGAVDGNIYTNSRDAIGRNYAHGTRLFEIDFHLTADEEWVGVRDWTIWQERTGYDGPLPPNVQAFNQLPLTYPNRAPEVLGQYTSFDLDWLTQWLTDHPDAKIITDIKDIKAFERFAETIQSNKRQNQFILQAYSIDHIDYLKQAQFEGDILLTLYRIYLDSEMLDEINRRRVDLAGLVIPLRLAIVENTLNHLMRVGLPVYVHGHPSNINSRALHADFAARGVSGFMLD